jgi:hypothetical protein
MYLEYENILNGVFKKPPLKSSQSPAAPTARLFTFLTRIASGLIAPRRKSA